MPVVHRIFPLFAAVAIAGCTAYGPLRSAPWERGNGYSEERLSESSYLVRYDGASGQPYTFLRPLLVRRAGELCKGSFIFRDFTQDSGFVMHSRKAIWPYVTAIVECGPPPIDKEIRFGDR